MTLFSHFVYPSLHMFGAWGASTCCEQIDNLTMIAFQKRPPPLLSSQSYSGIDCTHVSLFHAHLLRFTTYLFDLGHILNSGIFYTNIPGQWLIQNWLYIFISTIIKDTRRRFSAYLFSHKCWSVVHNPARNRSQRHRHPSFPCQPQNYQI